MALSQIELKRIEKTVGDMYDDSSPSIRLRAHTLLCLQGFRGEGYSPEFVENMAAIYRTLTDHPQHLVEVLASPDAVCGACPHRRPIGCTLNGDRSEEEMKDQDRVVLQRLGLEVRSRVRWQDILERIRSSASGDDLSSICGSCRWLPLGYCREGLNRLRNPTQGHMVGSLLDFALLHRLALLQGEGRRCDSRLNLRDP